MEDFINENNARPTRLLLRSDTISNWLLSSSTNLMYGEIGVGFDPNDPSNIIAKIGSSKDSTGQSWSSAPQINATVDDTGLDIENVGRVYASVVVDEFNNPVSAFTKDHFYLNATNNIRYLYGNLSELPHSLKCGTDGVPPNTEVLYYDAVVSPPRNYILPHFISGWNTTLSVSGTGLLDIFEAPLGFVHPEFGNVLPCDERNIHVLPIQPIKTGTSVLSWLDDVEVWTIPISPVTDPTNEDKGRGNYAMKFVGTVSGWFPFPFRQFISETDIKTEPTDGFSLPELNCQFTITPTSSDDTNNTNGQGYAGSGQFTVSVKDDNFSCDNPEFESYCFNQEICAACQNWNASVIEGANWFTITKIERYLNNPSCEPASGTIFYEYSDNQGYTPEERTAKVRVYMGNSVGSEIPSKNNYVDFTFTQGLPNCGVTQVFPSTLSVDESSHTQTFNVRKIYDKCTWNATVVGTPSWLTITSQDDVTTNTFEISINSNNTGETDSRTATIIVSDDSVDGSDGSSISITVSQSGNVCDPVESSPSIQYVPSFFGTTGEPSYYNFYVTYPTDCQDHATTAYTGIISGNTLGENVTIQNPEGDGDRNISYTLTPNPSIQLRQSIVGVEEAFVTVIQDARPCTIQRVVDKDNPNRTESIVHCGCDSTNSGCALGTILVEPYICGSESNCIQEEKCSWYVDVDHVNSTYPWINILGTGTEETALGSPTDIVEGIGYVRYSVDENIVPPGEICTLAIKVGYVRIIPLNGTETSFENGGKEFKVNSGCSSECACYPETEGCVDNTCETNPPEEPCANGYDVNSSTGLCECLCPDGSFPANGLCSNNPPACFDYDPNQPSPPETGPGSGGSDDPCGVTTFTKLYTIPEELGYTIVFKTPENASVVGDIGIIEIDTAKVANNFVRVQGFLNPGVSVVWNADKKLWEPKYVPNFYSEQISQDGFVYWNMQTKTWEITNVIDGGNA